MTSTSEEALARDRKAGTKGVPRGERERLILDAAVAEFGALGYAGASLATIAAGAGVSKPLVINYFGSKEQLYIACVERAGRNLVAAIEAVLTGTKPTLAVATDTITAIFAALEPRPHDWNVLNDRTTPSGSAAHAAAKHYRRLIAAQGARGVAIFIDDTHLDAGDAAVVADIWAGVVTAMVNWWLANPGESAADMSVRGRRIFQAVAAGD
ncbi:TetR/AcrR family transcriptional regulator [Nocardia sp. NPDC055321]